MPFSLRSILVVATLLLAFAAAGCGGGDGNSGSVSADAVAAVGDKEISRETYDRLIAQAEKTYKARKQDFPKVGTPEYEQLKQAIVRSLVEQAEFQIGAEELGIEVSDEDVEKRLDELKQQFFQGDEEKYKKEIAKQGVTDKEVREDVHTRLLSERIFKEVTKDVKVTDQEVSDYYDENKAQFETPASREVRHILIACDKPAACRRAKQKADDLYRQIRAGGDFAKLAKRFSDDPSSAEQGGKFTAQKGATVPPFDRTAFDLKTGELSKPVKTQFGWHIIQATSGIKPKSTRPQAEVEKDIRQQLLQQKQNDAMNKWVAALKKRLADEIDYAPGFRPPATTSTGATTTSG
jgi:parvulin-like peptidyl-prolyl isomerase